MQEMSNFGVHEAAARTIQRAANVYQSEVSRLAKQAGLSFPQYCVLRILAGSENALSCSDISERMVTRDPDITRLIDKLVKSGYASRERCTDDRRVVQSCITERGAELVDEVDQGVESLHHKLFARLGDDELRQLTSTLCKLPGTGENA